MYYKVIRDDYVVDVLTNMIYVKYQPKHEQMLLCPLAEAEAVLSSDGNYGFHTEALYKFEPDNYTYQIQEINKFEYENLKEQLQGSSNNDTTDDGTNEVTDETTES